MSDMTCQRAGGPDRCHRAISVLSLMIGDRVMITLESVRAAAARIAPHVRRTPLVSARALKDNPYPGGQLLLKLECLQSTGSF